jgi:hypothetical protein
MKEFAEHIVNTLLEIVAIQGTRWSGNVQSKEIITHYTTGDLMKQARLVVAL